VVVIAGPARDYLVPEIDALRSYLNKGGKALFMLDPPNTLDAPPLTNLLALAAEFGFSVGNDVVVDQSEIGRKVGGGPALPVVADYGPHPITQRLGRGATLFPIARSVTPATEGSRNAQMLFETSPVSWAETDVKALAEGRGVSFDATERRGPIGLGAAVAFPAPDAPAATPPQPTKPGAEPPARKETRVVVIGDSDFASNQALGFSANSDLFVNVLNWLGEQENLIAIRPKAPDDRRVTMNAAQLRMVALLVLVLVPGAVIGLGVLNWARRRR
jgi:ABC-type uncharacterized transport system involved in gliding motility auxiliary subunit